MAFRARSATLRAADVDRARVEERSLLHTWAMRNTLHLIATKDIGWLMPLFEPRLEAFARRRLAQLGMDAGGQGRAVRITRRALERNGPLSRGEVEEQLVRQDVEMRPQLRNHLIGLAVAKGIVCLGPDRGAQRLLVSAHEWLGKRPKHARDGALAELARRYVGGFGPATDRDFAKWSGLPLRDVRGGLTAIASELREVKIGEETAWRLKRAPHRPRGPVVRLLPAWDTYLMGYPDRSFMASPERWRRISDGGGMIAPTIVVDGAIVGIWRPGRRDEAVAAEAKPFSRLDPNVREAIAAEIADIARFESRQPSPGGKSKQFE